MSNIVTVNSGSAINGSLKAGRISISTDSSVTPSSGGKTWYNMINPAGGYTIISDPKIQGYNDGPPIIYPTQTTLPSDILATINGLPDRRGSVPFDNVWDALVWVRNTGKYFPLTKTYSGFPTDGLQVLVDGSNPFSSPGSGSNWYDLMNGAYFFPDNNPPTFHYDGYWDFEDSNNPGDNFRSSGTPNSNTQTQYTRLAFFNPETLDGNFKNLYCNVIGNNADMSLCVSNGKVSFHQYTTTSDYTVEGITVLSTGRWYFGAIVVDRSSNNLKIYLNGVLDREATISTIGNSNSNTQLIGGPDNDSYSGARMFDGKIALAAHYNKLLNASEIAQAYYGAPIVTGNISGSYQASNLVSYTPGNGNTYNMAANIISGSLQNGVEYKPDFGGYWKFDGVDDRILFEGSTQNAWILNSSPSWTVNAWVRTPNGSFGSTVNGGYYYGPILSNTNGGPIYSTFQINGGTIAYTHYNGSWLTKYGTTVVNDGNWHLLTWVNSSNSMNFYVDGKFDGTGASNISGVGWLDVIGQATSGYFIGDIASLQINQGKAFTASEVSQQYNAEYPRFKSSRDISKEGLVLDLDAGNPNSYLSGTTWTDLSGQGNNGTLNNGVGYTTDNGGALKFDGSDDYVNVSNVYNFDTSNALTIVCWAKSDTTTWSNYGFLVSRRNQFVMHPNISSQNVSYYVYTQNDWQSVGVTVPNIAQWNCYVYTYDGGTLRGYLNGILQSTATVGNNLASDTGDVYIGWDDGVAGRYLNGSIGGVKLYNKALTPQEVLNLYTNQAPRYRVQLPRSTTDSLALDVDFGNTTSYPRTGTTIYDRSGNGINGTATNGPVWSFENSGVYDLDGTDDYISFGNPSTLQYNYTNPFSLEIWIKWDGGVQPSNFGHVMGKTYANYRFSLQSSNDPGYITFRLDANNLVVNSGAHINSNTWHHVICTWEPSTYTARIYIDGINQGQGTDNTVNWTDGSQNFQMGNSPGENYYFNGKMALGKVYSKTLSPSEVLENYKSTRSRFGTDGIVTSNLYLHLDAGNVNSFDNSGNTIYDLSGGGNNGTLTNGPVFKNINGGTISFDGADDIITVPMANLRPTSAITEECWVYIENNTVQVFIGSQYGTGSNNSYAIWLTSTDVLAAGVNIGGSFNYQTKAYTISTNKWYYFAHTYDGTTQRIYANGVQIHSWATSGAITYNTNNTLLAVGNDWNGSGYNVGPGLAVEGNLSITRIYSTALSAAQILQNYNAERNRFGLD
jgi:hypothetical protein